MQPSQPKDKGHPQTQQQVSHPTWVKHHKKRNAAITAIIVSVLVIVIVIASLPSSNVKAGQRAPDFTIQSINGKSFQLYAQTTSVFMEFMRTTCSHCQNEAPSLTTLYSQYGSRVVFVSISIGLGDTPSMIQSFAAQYNQTWTFALDTSGLTQTYGVQGTPTIFVLDKSHVVQNIFAGETSLSTLQDALNGVA
ncbi:MAG TPA: TlpA disulfide reductase family protein [Candidatus Bathyarchaeia archaeon]|nr:TlpA disulfide reductase family protein [Candidatus Bathyarchaeia archaeon]